MGRMSEVERLALLADDDDRVRCLHCVHRCKVVSVPVPVRIHEHSVETKYVKRKLCRFGLGYDPVIKRRCDRYEALPAALRERLTERR